MKKSERWPRRGEGEEKEEKKKKRKETIVSAAVTANVGDRIFKRWCVVVLEGKQREEEIRVEKYFRKL